MAVYCQKFGLLPCLSRITSVSSMRIFTRHKSSALFIPGSKASEVFSFLTPHLDFDERFADIKKLEFNLKSRQLNVNVVELKESWEFYKFIDSNREDIDKQREDVVYKIKQLKKAEENEETIKAINALKLQGTVLKKDWKLIRDVLWELEETIIIKALSLPNDIDEITPLEQVVLQSYESIPASSTCKSHLDIGKSLDLIEYKNPLCYFLMNEAALFEVGALTWAGKKLSQSNLAQISGTDFSRSFVVEAAGLDHENPHDSFILDNTHDEAADKNAISKLHLMGGANFVAFLAMHTKQLINPNSLPLKFYACGRHYTPIKGDHDLGLFGVSQETAIQCFVVVNDQNTEYHDQFQKMIEIILGMYDQLGRHYRVVLKPANELRAWESLKVSFELWSKFKQNYIEVGHLSLCGDYCTKRLLIAYQTPKGKEYPAIISGNVLSITKLLGCLLEDDDDKFVIPECIKKCMPVDNENL